MASAAEKAANVLDGGDCDDGKQEDHAAQMDQSFDAGPDTLATASSLDQDEDKPSPVEPRKREHVEHGEVEADKSNKREQVVGSSLSGAAGAPRDPDRPGELGAGVAPDEPSDGLGERAEQLTNTANSARQRLGEGMSHDDDLGSELDSETAVLCIHDFAGGDLKDFRPVSTIYADGEGFPFAGANEAADILNSEHTLAVD